MHPCAHPPHRVRRTWDPLRIATSAMRRSSWGIRTGVPPPLHGRPVVNGGGGVTARPPPPRPPPLPPRASHGAYLHGPPQRSRPPGPVQNLDHRMRIRKPCTFVPSANSQKMQLARMPPPQCQECGIGDDCRGILPLSAVWVKVWEHCLRPPPSSLGECLLGARPARCFSINYPNFSPRFTLSWRSPPSRPLWTAHLPYKASCIIRQ